MKIPDSVRKLDKLLEYISFSPKSQHGAKPDEIFEEFKNSFKDNLDLHNYLTKLSEDGYISKSTWSNNLQEKGIIYFRLLNGEIYSLNGGYQNSILQNHRTSEIVTRQMELQNSIKNLTWVLAIAALFPAIYSIILIVDTFQLITCVSRV